MQGFLPSQLTLLPSLKVDLFKMTIRSFEEEKQKTKKKIIKIKQFLQSNGIQREKIKDFFFFVKMLIQSDWSKKKKTPTQIKEE